MRIVFSPGSERDLEGIADHIAQDNPRRALRFVQELRDATQALARNPEDGLERTSIRAFADPFIKPTISTTPFSRARFASWPSSMARARTTPSCSIWSSDEP